MTEEPAVTTLYAQFFRDLKEYPGWADARELATSRLPYALFGPTVVKHFPLFRTSQEDANFENYREQFEKYFNDNVNNAFGAFASASLKYTFAGHSPSDDQCDAAKKAIWDACRAALVATKKRSSRAVCLRGNDAYKSGNQSRHPLRDRPTNSFRCFPVEGKRRISL